MTPLLFHKYHGLGNDFVLVDDWSSTEARWINEADAVPKICDRRRGVGADGVLLVVPARNPKSDAAMIVVNADGSRPQMCGNGLRCVARFLYEDEESPLRGRRSFTVDTDAGPRQCELQPSSGEDLLVRVDMGCADFDRASLPMSGGGPFIEQELPLSQEPIVGTAVSMGNPHFVCFVQQGDLEQLARRLGPLVERHDSFPERTNVEMARVHPEGEIAVWVWERGVGITQACGTGACATAAAAVAAGRCPADTPLTVRLPGGELSITVQATDYRIWMTGPATRVYRGRITL